MSDMVDWQKGWAKNQWQAEDYRFQAMEPVPGEFVLSEDQVGIPGCYDSLAAASIALECDDDDLYGLQQRKNQENGGTGGVITVADLEPLKRVPIANNAAQPSKG